MPNPPFQPLTLSVEEWQTLKTWQRIWRRDGVKVMPNGPPPFPSDKAIEEIEAQAKEAASLRQRLEELNDNATKIHVEAVREQNNLRAHRDELLEKVDRLGAEYAAEIDLRLQEQSRASQAEAALAELQQQVNGFTDWLTQHADNDNDYLRAVAELQRRRSPRAEETK